MGGKKTNAFTRWKQSGTAKPMNPCFANSALKCPGSIGFIRDIRGKNALACAVAKNNSRLSG